MLRNAKKSREGSEDETLAPPAPEATFSFSLEGTAGAPRGGSERAR